MSTKIHDYWSFFAEDARRSGSPLYGYMAERIGGDAHLKALAARARPGQPHANMLLGAVHFLLLRGAEHPLKDYYPSLGGTRALDGGDAFALFRDFVTQHEAAIVPLIETRATNTNEVGRSALLHPGFRVAGAEAGKPLALIEIGPSAGLNMIWDRYGVRYVKDGRTAAAIAPDAKLVIDCELKGAKLPPTGPAPRVVSCVGLELNPNDLRDPDNRDWLRALVWPDMVWRLKRLEAAMALAMESPPDIVFGDALENLLPQLRAIPEQLTPCVYHTVALYQFSREMKAALEDQLAVAGLRRPVFRFGFEFANDERLRHLATLRRYHDGTVQADVLADAHPHGGWIEWLA